MADTPMKWYVLRSIAGKEIKVKEFIEAAKANGTLDSNYVGQILVPTEKVVQVRSGKRVVSERVLFRGYVYVQAALVGEIPHSLRNIPNVMGFLNGMENPGTLTQAEVERLMGAEAEQEVDTEAAVSFMVGEQVKVADGAFSSFNGVVSEVNAERKKLTVMVKVFGRETALNLGFGQVEKL